MSLVIEKDTKVKVGKKEGPRYIDFHYMTSSLFSTEIDEESRVRDVS